MNYYNQNAKKLFEKYQSAPPEKIHACWADHLPTKTGLALDVGGGSGRDAKWLAEKGWEVVVVEPAIELFKLGRKYTEGNAVSWIDDRLPSLSMLKGYQHRFSLILVSGVFMHLSYEDRFDSLRNLEGLLAENSIMVITLRHGLDSEERGFHNVAPEEIVEFADKNNLQSKVYDNLKDELGRKEVTWKTVVITKG